MLKRLTVAGFKKKLVPATDCSIFCYKEKNYCNRLHFKTFYLLLFYGFINVLIIPKVTIQICIKFAFIFYRFFFIVFL
jgi:hypothetical protein